jgi:hypothetical protein
MSFNNYDIWKLDNGDTGVYEDDFSTTAVGSEEELDEFQKRFDEMVLELAKECNVSIK